MDIKNDIIRIVKSDTTINKFEYWKEFFDKWEKILEKAYANKCVYTVAGITDKDQCYEYKLPFGNNVIDFKFSIKYLRDVLNYNKKNNLSITKIRLNNINGELVHGEFKCYYTKWDTSLKSSSSYDDIEDILIIPMPVGPYGFLIVDGNHRVCSQINENKDSIIVTYFDYKIAAASLSNPFELALYCFIEDYQKIRYNLWKIEHSKLYRSLNINRSKGALSILLERENKFNK